MTKDPKRIEICGGVASGKSTLASVAHQDGYDSVFEDFKKNPFWEAFYRDPGAHALETEITFLLQHFHSITNAPATFVVCDFSLTLDLAYADVSLSDSAHGCFSRVYSEVISLIGSPAALILLRCNPEEQLSRIQQRGRQEEENVDLPFLRNLNEQIRQRVAELRSDIHIVDIDSERLDFSQPGADRTEAAMQLTGLVKGLEQRAW